MTGSSSLPWALGRGAEVEVCVCICVCGEFRVVKVTRSRIIKSKMPPVDKKSLGKSACLRALGTEASLSLSLVLFLPVLLLLSFCLSVCLFSLRAYLLLTSYGLPFSLSSNTHSPSSSLCGTPNSEHSLCSPTNESSHLTPDPPCG